jgi:hypothetical protein
MPKYDNNDLRRDILITLAYVPFSSFRIKAILSALLPTGYEDLTETSLMGQIKYLEQKNFVTTERARNVITQEETTLITITCDGIDILEGKRRDVGVSRG